MSPQSHLGRLRRLACAALVAAAAGAQDAASANFQFTLIGTSPTGGVAASGTKSAALVVEPVGGSMTSGSYSVQLGAFGGVSMDALNGPQILDVSPSLGSCTGGETVRIRGLNFNQGGGAASATVKVGAAPAFLPSAATDQEIFFTAPPGNAGFADVRVTTAYGSLTLPAAYQYVCPGGPPTTIFSMTPVFGDMDGGTLVTLNGLSFVPGSAVLFDGVPATNVTIVNPETLTCRTPAHLPGYATPVVVNLQGVGSLPLGFEYRASAKVTNLGGGHPGTYGQPQQFLAGALPILGGPPFQAVLANAAHSAPAALILGPEVPGYLFPGTTCLLFISPNLNIFLPATTSVFGTAFLTFQIPDIPFLAGYTFAAQWAIVDENGAYDLFSASNALRLRLGYLP